MPDLSQYLNETGFLQLESGQSFPHCAGIALHLHGNRQEGGTVRVAADRHRSHNRQPASQCFDTACPGPAGSGRAAGVRRPWAHLSFRPLLLEHTASLDIPWPWRSHRLHAYYREAQDAASGWSGAGGHLRGFLGSPGYQPCPRNRHRLLHQGSGVYRHHRRRGRPHHDIPFRHTGPRPAGTHRRGRVHLHGRAGVHTASLDAAPHHQTGAPHCDASQRGRCPSWKDWYSRSWP